MLHGRCTNFDDPCPKQVTKEVIAIPDGAEFVCPECGRELMAVEGKRTLGARLAAVPVTVRLIALALPLAALIGVGIFAVVSSGEAEPGSTDRAENVEHINTEEIIDSGNENGESSLVDMYFNRVNGYLNKLVQPDLPNNEADATIRDALALFDSDEAMVRIIQNDIAVERITIRNFLIRQKLLKRDVAATRNIQINPQGKITQIEIAESTAN